MKIQLTTPKKPHLYCFLYAACYLYLQQLYRNLMHNPPVSLYV